MRTLLAALCLAAVAILAVVGTSLLLGKMRVELVGATAEAPARTTLGEAEPGSAEPVGPGMAETIEEDPFPAPSPPPSAEATAPAPPAAADESAPAVDPTTVATAPRIVGGQGITPGIVSPTPLEREAVPPKPPEPARWRAFRRVTVVEASRLDIGKRQIELAGLTLPAPETMCRRAPGEAKATCAFLAMQAMRKRIRALGVECQISIDETADPAIAPCRLGKTDLSLWLIEQGWAEAAPGAPDTYAAAETRARCAGKGLWLEAARPDGCPGE